MRTFTVPLDSHQSDNNQLRKYRNCLLDEPVNDIYVTHKESYHLIIGDGGRGRRKTPHPSILFAIMEQQYFHFNLPIEPLSIHVLCAAIVQTQEATIMA